MSIKDLPLAARPREKLLARGAIALGDAELLAVILRTGMPGKGVLQLAQELLDTFGGLAGLLNTEGGDLKRIKGLGGEIVPMSVEAFAEMNKAEFERYGKLIREGRTAFEHLAEVHNTLSEDVSFRRVIRLAEKVPGTALYMMHVSAATGVSAIHEARARGVPATWARMAIPPSFSVVSATRRALSSGVRPKREATAASICDEACSPVHIAAAKASTGSSSRSMAR